MNSPLHAGIAPGPAPTEPRGCPSRSNVAVLLHTAPADATRAVLDELARGVERALPKGWHIVSAEATDEALGRVIADAAAQGAERIVVLPTRPQFSARSTGRALAALYRTLSRSGPDMQVEVRASWADDAAYIQGLAEEIGAAAKAQGAMGAIARAVLVAGAEGDDSGALRGQLERTALLVAEHLGWPAGRVGVWCAGGDVDDADAGLDLDDGSVIACPADPMAAGWASPVEHGCGVWQDARWCEPARVRQQLVKAMAMVVRRGRHPAAAGAARAAERCVATPVRHLPTLTKGLFMLGASVAGAAPDGDRSVHCCTSEEFLAIKRPHLETMELLHSLRDDPGLAECFIFNTCHRFELYGWMSERADGEPEALLERLGRVIGHEHRSALCCAHGREAWRHLLRTAAGLNSGLIGDADVLEQLESGLRAAGHVGAAGARSMGLVERAMETVEKLRSATPWGTFTHRYAQTAVTHLPPEVGALLGGGRVAVVGGSTTAVSLVETLRERYGMTADRITLFYRGHRRGALMNRLMRALGADRMEHVESYADPRVVSTVGAADVAFLASDHRGALLDARRLLAARGPRPQPLVVVDFNSFGSLDNRDMAGVRVFDAATIARVIDEFNIATLADPAFLPALQRAEGWISGEAQDSGPGAGQGRGKGVNP